MTRKLDTSRVYKVIRFLVILISVSCLLYALYVITNHEEMVERATKFTDECVKKHENLCSIYYENLTKIETLATNSLLTGVGLLACFYGGGVLIDYIAPKIESKPTKKIKERK